MKKIISLALLFLSIFLLMGCDLFGSDTTQSTTSTQLTSQSTISTQSSTTTRSTTTQLTTTQSTTQVETSTTQVETSTITFNSQGGSGISPITIAKGQYVSLPRPNKEGHDFLGWSTVALDEGSIVPFNYQVTNNITLYAIWSLNQYELNYYIFDSFNPLAVMTFYADEEIMDISAGRYHVAALTSLGRVFTWGSNWQGQLGDRTNSERFSLAEITQQFDLEQDESIIKIDMGSYHSAALSSNNRLFVWGGNNVGQLGNGNTMNSNYPIDITANFNLGAGEVIVHFSMGNTHSSAVTSLGRVFTWGWNNYGQIGNQVIDSLTYEIPVDITDSFDLLADEIIVSTHLGGTSSSALTSLGRVFTWGSNANGKLGDGGTQDISTPVDITTNFNLDAGETIVKLSLKSSHSAALTSLGRVFTWGFNEFAQLGDGTYTTRLLPVDITSNFNLDGLEVIKDLVIGDTHSLVVTSKNRVFTWGRNQVGQLGFGQMDELLYNLPVDITSHLVIENDEEIIGVRLGLYSTVLFTSSNRVFVWGNNGNGELGDGTNVSKVVPTELYSQTISLVKTEIYNFGEAIADFNPTKLEHNFIGWFTDFTLTSLNTQSTMPAKNLNFYGKWTVNLYSLQFIDDDGTIIDSYEFEYDQDLTTFQIPVAEKTGYTFNGWDQVLPDKMPANNLVFQATYIINQYTITFESNGGDQVLPITQDYNSLIQEPTTPNKEHFTFSGWYTDATLSNEFLFDQMPSENITLYAKWDHIQYAINYVLNQGVNDLDNPESYTYISETFLINAPKRVGYTFLGWFDNQDFSGSIINEITFNSRGDITLYAKWQINQYSVDYYIYDDFDPSASITLFPGETILDIALGQEHSMILTSFGRIYGFGSNSSARLGLGLSDEYAHPKPIEITDQFALFEGELIISISAGNAHSGALTSLGRLFLWGNNYDGQIGIGVKDDITPTPTDITNFFNLDSDEFIVKVSLGASHSGAITSKGRVFTWGNNIFGQTGNGESGNFVTLPLDITSRFLLAEDEEILSISLGLVHSAALTSTGRVFTWGFNNSGQLGDGTLIDKHVPVEITTRFNLHQGETIILLTLGDYHSSALSSEGRLFTWGRNNFGQLGDGTTIDKLNPQEITSQFAFDIGEAIDVIALGVGYSSIITSSGRLFTWGDNGFSKLGNGLLTSSSIPIEINGFLDLVDEEGVKLISLGEHHTVVISTNDQIFGWGKNNIGQLGSGTTKLYTTIPLKINTQNLHLAFSETLEYNSSLTMYAPIIQGYVLDKWYYDLNMLEEYELNNMPANDLILYGKFTLVNYVISYELDGGVNNVDNPLIYTIETDAFTLKEPSKEYHTFLGWYDNPDFTGNQITLISQGSFENLSLYARWEPTQYNIFYNIIEDYNPLSKILLYPGEEILSVSLGREHSMILTSLGRVFAWGNNGHGRLGDGTNVNSSLPIEITSNFNLSDDEVIIKIDLGAFHSSALTSNGRLFTWGHNGFGQLGDGSTTSRFNPTDITGKFNLTTDELIIEISMGEMHSSALTSLGRVFTWGNNSDGRLGNGTTTFQKEPIEITNHFALEQDEVIVSVMVGENSSALSSKGRLFVWGPNSSGQLGDGTTESKHTPIDLTSQFNLNQDEVIFKAIIGRNHSAVLTSTGRLFTWGNNYSGKLGDNSTVTKLTPNEITNYFMLESTEVIIDVSFGTYHSSALTSQGRLFTWGLNWYGQLGIGKIDELDHMKPIDITNMLELDSMEEVIFIDLGDDHSSVITSFGNILIWGKNNYGQLGDSSLVNNSKPSLKPIQYSSVLHSDKYPYDFVLQEYVPNQDNYLFHGWYIDSDLSIEYTFNTMPAQDLVLYGYWEAIEYSIIYNLNGGENHLTNPAIYNIDSKSFDLIDPFKEGYVFLGWYDNPDFSGDVITSILQGTSGDIMLYAKWIIGEYYINYYTLDSFDPLTSIILYPNEVIISINLGYYHAAALTSNGRLFMWGSNSNGQLGNGTTVDSNKPIEITDQFDLIENERIIYVSLGLNHSLAITSMNRIFVWGSNSNGQLGDGTNVAKHTPVEITSKFDLVNQEYFVQASLGYYHTLILTSKGRVFGWGNNEQGQLGLVEIATTALTPVDLTVIFNLEIGDSIVKLESGGYHQAALSMFGRIFIWGGNQYGQIGDGSTNNRYSPLELKEHFNLTEGETIADIGLGYVHSGVVTSLGRVFTWGWNIYGQLGDGSKLDSLSPTEITESFALEPSEKLLSISLGRFHSAVSSSKNRIFTWGSNWAGQLGDGTNNESVTPKDITGYLDLQADETIEVMMINDLYSAVLTSKGRVLLWGQNSYGRLGNGTSIDQSMPTAMKLQNLVLDKSEMYVYDTLTSIYLPLKTGYDFLGEWYSGKDFSALHVFENMPGNSFSLYSYWIVAEYTITYNLNGGTNSTLNPLDYTIESETINLLEPHKEGYTFVGWYGNIDFLGDVFTSIETGTHGNIELYAKWTINQYEVNYYVYEDYDPAANIVLYPGETIISVSLGESHVVLLTSFGRVYTWGKNNYGQLGNGTTTPSSKPLEISDKFELYPGEEILAISTGTDSSGALTSLGRIFTWGSNSVGELGNGTFTSNYLPNDITNLFNLDSGEFIEKIVFSHGNAAALTSEGRLFTWGFNIYGQIGNGTVGNRNLPTDITNQFNLEIDEVILDVAIGALHAMAITSQGRIFTWGYGEFGQLGTGFQTLYLPSPTEITDQFVFETDEVIESISLGIWHSSLLTSKGRLYVWGYNFYGQLGDGTTVLKSSPIEITNQFILEQDEMIINVELGGYMSSVITSQGRMFTWGWNDSGQLGDGTTTNSNTPMDITSQFNFDIEEGVVSVSLQYRNSSVISSNGKLFTWGFNNSGQLGDLTYVDKRVPTYIASQNLELVYIEYYDFEESMIEYLLTRETFDFDGWYQDIDLTLPYQFTLMTSKNINLYGKWEVKSYNINYYLEGNDNFGELVAGVFNSFYLRGDGLLYGTGRNDYWALGIGNVEKQADYQDITPFMNLDSGEKVLGVASSWYHTIAFTSNGRVFTWGYNSSGQLGNSTGYSSSIPVDITDSFTFEIDEQVVQVQAGVNFTVVLTNQGRVFTFGNNGRGALGDGTTTNKIDPVNITANFQLEIDEIIVQIIAKGHHVLAMSSNGRLFGFGKNDYGSLGNNTTNDSKLPIDLTGYLNLLTEEEIVKVVAGFGYSIILTSTGRVLATGWNGQGIIGDGTQNHTYVFIDVTSYFSLNPNETIKDIVSLDTISLAKTSENRVLAYGSGIRNIYGSTSYLPVDITDKFELLEDEIVVYICTGASFSFVLTNLNRVIGFGKSDHGQLGIGEFNFMNLATVIDLPLANVELFVEHVKFGNDIELLNPQKEGYTFGGWYLDENLTIVFDLITMPAENITLYAKWIEN